MIVLDLQGGRRLALDPNQIVCVTEVEADGAEGPLPGIVVSCFGGVQVMLVDKERLLLDRIVAAKRGWPDPQDAESCK